MIAAILAAEVAFWIVLGAGLTARYVLHRRRASTVLLWCVPLVDVVLVTFVAIDIARGAEPSRGHALAAVYLAVTVAFGHRIVSWADVRFRHRFAGGPAPRKPARGSAAYVRGLWQEWFRVVLAAVISAVLLLGMITLDGFHVPSSADEFSHDPYWATMWQLALVTGIWFLAGPAFARRSPPPPSTG